MPERPTKELCNVEAAGAKAAQQTTESNLSHLRQPHSNSNSYAIGDRQNRLMWNLFAQGLDRILISLLTESQKVKTLIIS